MSWVAPPSLALLLQDAPLSDCTDTIDGLDGSEGSYSPAKSIRKVLTAPVTCTSPISSSHFPQPAAILHICTCADDFTQLPLHSLEPVLFRFSLINSFLPVRSKRPVFGCDESDYRRIICAEGQ